jgi:two-component system nitrate/nitrite sensor histidine kinase NarX
MNKNLLSILTFTGNSTYPAFRQIKTLSIAKLMQKQIFPIEDELEPNSFLWVREPDFTPPGEDGGLGACLAHEFSHPRIGELKSLLEVFLENIVATVHATAGIVQLTPPDGRTLQIISSTGVSSELQAEAENCISMKCTTHQEGTKHGHLHHTDFNSRNLKLHAQCAECHFASRVSAQLEASNSTLLPFGTLTLFFDQPKKVTALTLDTIAAFSKVMNSTIEHTHINREAKRVELMKERIEMANDIHDSIAQTLTYARMRVSLLREAVLSNDVEKASKYVHDLDEALDIGQQNTRELISDHRCELNHSGLPAALHDLIGEFHSRYEIAIEYHNHLIDLELPLEYEIQVYNIVQEALTNIARHSGASHARLFVDQRFGYYVFTIEDNGSGACTFTPVEGHYGMKIMQERATQIGGKINFRSTAGLGTQVQLFFPQPSLDWSTVNE